MITIQSSILKFAKFDEVEKFLPEGGGENLKLRHWHQSEIFKVSLQEVPQQLIVA
jgi:hypothetical protein